MPLLTTTFTGIATRGKRSPQIFESHVYMRAQVAIIGCGPGGTATSLFLAKKGISSVIVEKEAFPRYHIGESLTGECGQCLVSLGLDAVMRQQHHPIKYGVKVFGPEGKNTFYVPVMKRTDLGLEQASTWQVRRSVFDQMLLDTAVERGADYLSGRVVAPLRSADGAVAGVRVATRTDENVQVHADVVVDASGQATFLSHAGVAGRKERGRYDKQVAVFSQVRGAIRDEGIRRDDTLIFYRAKNHWAWFIPLDQEVVSIGVVVPSDYFQRRHEPISAFLVRELREINSELTRRLPSIELTEEVRAISNYSYHIREFTGRNFLCVGDSHRFVDPIFSFGVYFSVKEAQFAADAIEAYFAGAHQNRANPFSEYQKRCEDGQDAIQTLIDAFWDNPFSFAFFAHSRYREEFIDLFAGRLYGDVPNRGLQALRALTQHMQRKPSYAPHGGNLASPSQADRS